MNAAAASRQHAPGDAGIVLITVIWLLALLGGLVMAMSLFASSVLGSIDTYNDAPRAEAALSAGLNHAVADLLVSDAEPPSPRTPPASGSTMVGTVRVSWSAINEAARVDVNAAAPELLTGLFVQLGAAPDDAARYAAQIAGFRSSSGGRPAAAPDKPPGYDPNEETPAAIAALARGGQPKAGQPDPHRPFVDVAQLQQVSGLPAGLMARAAPYLTTFNGSAEIDARAAAPQIIAALPGITRERLRTVMAARNADPATLADALGDAKRLTTDKRSPATRITVRVALPDGSARSTEIVVVHFTEDASPFRVLAWDDASPNRQPTQDASQ